MCTLRASFTIILICIPSIHRLKEMAEMNAAQLGLSNFKFDMKGVCTKHNQYTLHSLTHFNRYHVNISCTSCCGTINGLFNALVFHRTCTRYRVPGPQDSEPWSDRDDLKNSTHNQNTRISSSHAGLLNRLVIQRAHPLNSLLPY